MLDVLGNIRAVCARELTKKFEEIKRGSITELIEHFSKNRPKGEFVILINQAMLKKGDKNAV